MHERLNYYYSQNRLIEVKRLEQLTNFDIEMMLATGMCKGGGDQPPALFECLSKDVILFVDESHVTVPQIDEMYSGNKARKEKLIDYGLDSFCF